VKKANERYKTGNYSRLQSEFFNEINDNVVVYGLNKSFSAKGRSSISDEHSATYHTRLCLLERRAAALLLL